MTTDTTTLLEASTRFHLLGYNVVACGGIKDGKPYFKRPGGKWKEFESTRQSIESLKGQQWATANGLALVNGVGRIRAVDFDAVKNEDGSKIEVPFEVVKSFCQVLGIEAESYEWIVKTGNGWHVWLLCDDMSKKVLAGEDEDLTKADFKPSDSFKSSFDHIELRWKNHFTVIPPSQHSEEKWYRFRNCEFPSSLPAEVPGDKVAEAVRSICNMSTPANDSGHRRPESKPSKERKQSRLSWWTEEKVRSALSVIPTQQEHITWKKTVAAVVDAIGKERAVPLLEAWSPIPPGKTQYPDVIDSGLDRVTAGSLVMIAREHGWNDDDDEQTLAERVQSFLLDSFEFQYNVVKRQLEYRAKDSDSWNLADDRTFEQWAVTFEKKRLHKRGVSPEKVRLYAQDDAICRAYDPIKDFFDGLPTWDGNDHIARYASAVPLKDEDNRETFVLHLKKWLVGTYSCGYFGGKGGSKNELFLILHGKQGDGKTIFLRRLTEGELERYRCENYDATKKEDVYAILSKSFICIDEELESLSKKEASSLKRLLSSEFFEFRSAYARAEVTHIRRVSFCGSVNDQTFLKDQTGNRRFLVHSVGEVKQDVLFSVDMRQVWAQAKHLYEEGFRHWLDREEQKVLNVTNSEFEVVDSVEEILLRYLRPATANERGDWLQTFEIAELLSKQYDNDNTEGRSNSFESTPITYRNAVTRLQVNNALLQRLGNLLAKAGFEKKKVKRDGDVRQCYKVARVSTASYVGHAPEPTPGNQESEKKDNTNKQEGWFGEEAPF